MKKRATPEKSRVIKSIRRFLALTALFLSFGVSNSVAQDGRFQKLGVTLDPWAERQIHFWKKVYTEYDSGTYLIHDSMNLSRVYSTVKGEARISAEKRRIIDLLNGIAKKHPSHVSGASLNEEERKLYEALDAIEDGRAYRFAAEPGRIRVQSGQKDRLDTAFLISRHYLKRMEEMFEEEGVPKELALLPFVESSFNHEARSSVGASGIWQFMPGTASRDLRVTRDIDERFDPLKSTRAAARFLRRNHELLKSWSLAIMAYHHGPGLVDQAVKNLKTHDPIEIIKTFKHPSYRFASRNYLFEFLAMCDVHAERAAFFQEEENIKLPTFITVSFPKRLRMKKVMEHYRLKEGITRVLNPHFREPIWRNEGDIPAHYPIRMAGITLEEFRKLEYP
jgi:membrane-bound lytic murein transglycosylase D